MTRLSKTKLGTAAFFVILALAGSAGAQSSASNAAAAQALFDEGRQLYEKKQYAEAIDRLKRSQQLDPSVGALISIAEAYEALGKLASAWSAWNEAARLATTKNQAGRAKIAQNNAAQLAPKLARLSINTLPGRTLTVNRNGEKVDPAALNTPVPVDAGHYVVDVTSPHKKPFHGEIDVTDGASEKLQVPELEPDGTDTTPPPPPPPPPVSNTQRNVGIGMEIGGGALVAVGLIFGGVAMGSWNSVTANCPSGVCPSDKIRSQNESDYDSARTFSTLSTVGVIAGAAILAGGVVLHLTAPKHDLALNASPGGLSLTFTE